MIARGLLLATVALVAAACNSKGEVTEADAARNKAEFSQENYEAAMKAAGKGDELAAEKARNDAYESGGQTEGQR